jgi:hydroxymethylglutaryl-CoA synthase
MAGTLVRRLSPRFLTGRQVAYTRGMRGLLSIAGAIPHHRLRRERIAEVVGGSPGTGTRAVASYDEDATALGVAAARRAVAGAGGASPRALWFATATAPYLERTNATAIHAALRLDGSVPAMDLGGAPRAGTGAVLAALRSTDAVLVVAADVRTGRPRSTDESATGDAGVAALVGSDDDGPLLAEVLATATATEEFVDRWRVPGEAYTRTWEDRFGETRYVPLATDAAKRACAAGGVELDDVDVISITGLHGRAVRSTAKALQAGDRLADDLGGTVGATGTPHPLLTLAAVLEDASPGATVLQVSLADGADAILWRVTDAIDDWQPTRPVRAQVAGGDDRLAYADFLAWRGMLEPEPPNRPDPARPSSSAAARSTDWKYGFVGSRDRTSGAVHLPPARVSFRGGAVDDMEPAPMADARGTVATFTIDRLAWSPSPPTVFAVLDLDGGGRFACEVTDCRPDELAIGDRVEMTFRVLHEADGIRNYFWKATPVREGEA